MSRLVRTLVVTTVAAGIAVGGAGAAHALIPAPPGPDGRDQNLESLEQTFDRAAEQSSDTNKFQADRTAEGPAKER